MLPSRNRSKTVTCIACDVTVNRDEAREYDKFGNRWNREDKTFEHLCKPCFSDLSRHARGDLEAMLTELDAGNRSNASFLTAYSALVEERYGRLEER